MRLRPPSRVFGALAAALAGLLLFGASALVERLAGAGPAASGVIEEILKALVVWGFAAVWSAASAHLAREADRREALADGLSMSLVAVAIFAAIENLAYSAAFQEAGILARLAWATPLHVGAAEALALGCLGSGRGGAVRRVASAALGLVGAIAWHAAANTYAATGPRAFAFAAPAIAFILAALALGAAFRKKAYIGGLFNEA